MSNIAKRQKKSVNALLHAEFKRIKKRALGAVADGVQPSAYGICYMMKDDLYSLFKGDRTNDTPRVKAFNAWPKSSGSISCPILVTYVPKECSKIDKIDAAIKEYSDSRGMRWAGRQLEARLDLLDHLIEFFKPPVMPRTALLNLLRVDMQAEGYTHREGICGAILHNLPYAAHIVCGEARRAISPKNYVYPVELKGEKGGISFSHHARHGTLWVGEYGAARKAYALLLADYIAANYTVHLNHNKQSKVQETFRKVIDGGYYDPLENAEKSSRYMCLALDYANKDGVIRDKEREEASAAIKEYMVNPYGTRVMLNVLYYAGIVKDSLYMGKNIQVLVKLYTNWDKRPELKR